MTQRPEQAPAGPVRVGDYRLVAKIGEGGMGVVHLAQSSTGERVALKVLRPHVVGDEEGRSRLAREVASLRRVRSVRVAEIVDADPWGETPFVATRYVPGLSLHQHVSAEGPIRPEDLTLFATGLMEALVAVHRVGVLHRDVKPSNVLLEGRAPVLIDFGLARLAEDPRLTHTGWLLGTPGYLAPEILYGEDATVASDVHAWAATVAFAATGHPPFGGGPAMAIMDRVRRGEHDLSGVPDSLRPLLVACLSPAAVDRPSATEVLARLTGRPSPSPRTSWAEGATAPYATMPADTDRTGLIRTRGYTVAAPTSASPALPALPRVTAPRVARLQRGLLLAGGLVAVTAGFVSAPYLTCAVVAGLVQCVRTFSWTAEAARLRRQARGRRRWYDPAVTVSTSPWYLFVALGGTLLLIGWAFALAMLVALAGFMLGLSALSTVLPMGAVLAAGVWWGPGARRLRVPVRRVLGAATRNARVGWTLDTFVVVLVALLIYAAASTGIAGASVPLLR